MSWDAVGAVAELVGALGVIFSLVYLARQIRQNSELVEQSTRAAGTQAAVLSAGHGYDFLRAIALEPSAARLWSRGLADPAQLDEEELARFDLLMSAQIIQMDVNLHLGTSGPLDAEVHAIWENILDRWLRHPRFVELWRSGRMGPITTASFARHVRARFDALQASGQAESAP